MTTLDDIKATWTGHVESVSTVHRDLDRAYALGQASAARSIYEYRQALTDLLACVDHEGDPDWDWAIKQAREALA